MIDRVILHRELKSTADVAYHQALRDRVLTRSSVCQECGATNATIDGHHRDYSKPLEVQWLCRSVCHSWVHRRFLYDVKLATVDQELKRAKSLSVTRIREKTVSWNKNKRGVQVMSDEFRQNRRELWTGEMNPSRLQRGTSALQARALRASHSRSSWIAKHTGDSCVK